MSLVGQRRFERYRQEILGKIYDFQFFQGIDYIGDVYFSVFNIIRVFGKVGIQEIIIEGIND